MVASLLALLLALNAFAQKDAPVVGNAAALVDLLRRDYNAMDPASRQEEISKDRTQLIAVLKAYLTDQDKQKVFAGKNNTKANAALNALNVYNECKKKTAALASQSTNFSDADEAGKAAVAASTAAMAEEKAKMDFYNSRSELDVEELECIKSQYSSGGNQYLAYVIQQFQTKYEAVKGVGMDEFAIANTSVGIQKNAPFLGGDLNFTMVIDGLAKFLAKRMKEELTTYVIDRVKAWLQNPSEDDPLAEFKVLLPQTTAFLVGFTADRVTNFPNEIKQYIEDDLNHLLQHAPGLRNTPRISKLISNHPDLDFALEALEIIPLLSSLKTPADYFNVLENSRNLARWKQGRDVTAYNVANSIYLAGMMARSLMIVDNGEKRFAGVDYLANYMGELHFYLLYTGFLYQQSLKYSAIGFRLPGSAAGSDPFLFSGMLKKIVEKDPVTLTQLDSSRQLLEEVLGRMAKNAEKVYNIAAEIKRANQAEKKIGVDTIYQYAASIIDLSEEVVASADTLMVELIGLNYTEAGALKARNPEIRKKTAPYFALARTSNEIFNDLAHKKYATALIKGIDISSQLVQQNEFTGVALMLQRINNLSRNATMASWSRLIDTVLKTQWNGYEIKKAALVADFSVALGEANKLFIYSEQNRADTLLRIRLKLLKDNLRAGWRADRFVLTQAVIDSTVVLIGDAGFRKMVVSYYANVLVDTLVVRVKGEMQQFVMKDIRGDTMHVFTAAEADTLTSAIFSYVYAVFTNYYIEGLKSAGNALLEERDRLFRTVTAFLSLLPQKLNVAADPRLMNLVHFVNDMAIAQNSDDVAKAIDAFALPSGSYAIKRSAAFNFSINSYPGVLPAAEFSWGHSGNTTAFTTGFTAPVGLGLSWSTRNGHSNGLFIPILDIGAVTRFRFDAANDSIKTLPEITFRNVFAPGLYYTHGFKKCPLALNIGFQYGPQLQEIVTDNTTAVTSTRNYDAIRIGVGLVFDIPLLNLHTKPRE